VSAESWLLARDPAPPASLAARLRAVIGRLDPAASASTSSDAYLRAGEQLLAQLLRDGCASRESALDLLTADALVTYAFEAASDDPATLERRAQLAMTRIAALAGERPS
jgi:hypothetical protein